MMQNFRHNIISLYLFILLLASGCARNINPDVERGSEYIFQDGFPEARISSLGYLDETGQPIVNISVDLEQSSLIFQNIDDLILGRVKIEIRILGKESDFIKTDDHTFVIEQDEDAKYYEREQFNFQQNLEVEPGDLEIYVSVLDLNTGKVVEHESTTFIPDPESPEVNLTTIRLLGKDMEIDDPDYLPMATYNIPAKMDSLQFVFQATNNDMDNPLVISSRLMRFKSDTTYARPMSFPNYTQASLPFRGIDYRDFDEVDRIRRVLDQPGSVLIEFKYEMLERGNYRFEITTEDDNGEEIYKARDFSIKSENYPNIATAREMAVPLIYLMEEKEHKNLMEIKDPDSLKSAIDRFWLSNIQNSSLARSVISLYYDRVEEANKRFSSFKEGWKTDQGMMFILFGPPLYSDRNLNRMVWSYSYNQSDPRTNFVFERPRVPNEYFPFSNYLLQRSSTYFNVEYQQRQRWLSGFILRSRM